MPQNTNNYSEQNFNLVCEVNILKPPTLHCKPSVWFNSDRKLIKVILRYDPAFRWWITSQKDEPVIWGCKVKALQVLCIYVAAADEEPQYICILIQYWWKTVSL